MSGRKKILIVLASLAAFGLPAWFLTPRTPDPVCNGKRLSKWLDDYGSDSLSELPQPGWHRADRGVRLAGTNAIPLLLKYTMAHDGPVKLRLMALARRQRFLRITFVPDRIRLKEAVYGFSALGPDAAVFAVPQLMRIYNDYPTQRPTVLRALGEIGPAAKEAIPLIIGATTNVELVTRAVAIIQVCRMRLEPDVIVPVLVRGLSDTNLAVQIFSVIGLGEIGPGAKPAMPQLLELRRAHTNPPPAGAPLWKMIDDAIEKIDPGAARYDAPK